MENVSLEDALKDVQFTKEQAGLLSDLFHKIVNPNIGF